MCLSKHVVPKLKKMTTTCNVCFNENEPNFIPMIVIHICAKKFHKKENFPIRKGIKLNNYFKK
jgi:hypothetical protein